MIKILTNDVEKIVNEYSALDRSLAKIEERLTTVAEQCGKQGDEIRRALLRKATDAILENRRALYECSEGLSRIRKIYEKSEERVQEEIDGIYQRVSRETTWIEFSFSADMMELIHKIEI